MSYRITIKNLEALCEALNKATGSPLVPYVRGEDGKLRGQIGNFHVSSDYGGFCIHRMANEQGGVTTPIVHGHIPARDLFERMHCWLAGYNEGKKA